MEKSCRDLSKIAQRNQHGGKSRLCGYTAIMSDDDPVSSAPAGADQPGHEADNGSGR